MDSNAIWWYLLRTFLQTYLKDGKRTLLRRDLKPVLSSYFEIELIPSSVSEIENFGLDESSAEVAAVVASYIAKKGIKDSISLDCRKCLILNPEAGNHSAFECFEYLLTLSCGG